MKNPFVFQPDSADMSSSFNPFVFQPDSACTACAAGEFYSASTMIYSGNDCETTCDDMSSSFIRRCANCGDSENGGRFSCGKCMVATYCSRECQLKNWKTGGHQQVCVLCVQCPDLPSQKDSTRISCGAGKKQ